MSGDTHDTTAMARLVDEEARRRLEAARRAGRPLSIESCLPPAEHPGYLATLEELVHVDLDLAWQAHGRQAAAEDPLKTVSDALLVEEYLKRFPALDQPLILRRLLAQEWRVRRRGGQDPSLNEYEARFPGLLSGAADTLSSPRPRQPVVPSIPGYEIEGELGRGGMGVVYQARQVKAKRLVAIKMILTGAYAGAEEQARFRTEAEASARLQHPNIVQVFEVGEHEGRPFFSMEFCGAGSLAARLKGTPLAPLDAARIVETLARAMNYAHRQGVIHRDLKPANVLLTDESGRTTDGTANGAGASVHPSLVPKITDFGLAKKLDEAGQTATGAVLGTPSYIAPEQAAGVSSSAAAPQQDQQERVGPGADIYALGAILYECLTGRPPFRAATAMETLLQVLHNEPASPCQLQPGVPRDLETICLKCLNKTPSQRYATAEDLADDLRRLSGGEPILARPVGVVERWRKWARRRPAVAGLLGLLVLVVGAALVGLTLLWRLASGERDEAKTQRARAENKSQEALNNLQRATSAEQDVRRQLAQAHVFTGRLAMQQGRWQLALDHFTQAEGGGADAVALAILKVRAWSALHQIAPAQRELQALSQRSDLGPLQASVLLWQADLLLSESQEEEKALVLVQKALDLGGLAPAEEAYARGLLAPSTPEALGHFERAVREDPFHHRAGGMLALLLLMAGRHEEAGERIRLGELLFPDDPSFKVLHALLLAARDDLAGALKIVQAAQDQLGAAQFAATRDLVEATHQLIQLEAVFLDLVEPSASTPLTLLKLVRPSTRALAAYRGKTAPLLLPVPPVFNKALRGISAAVPHLVLGFDKTKAHAELQRALAIHPDGFLQFLWGLSLASQDRWAEAEKAFEAAAQAPSFLRIRRTVRYCLAVAAWMQAIDAASLHRVELLGRALQQLRLLAALGPVGADQAATLTQIAHEAGDLHLARSILGEAERRARPDHEGLLRQRLRVEFKAGSYFHAVRAADALLARAPKDAEALERRAVARERLLKQAQSLGPR